MHRFLVALVPLAACDLGTLIGTDAVHSLGELGGIPEEAAWDLRWYRGEAAGLASGCPLVPAEDIDPEASDANVISDGTLYVPPPEPAEPAFWLEGDGYRWAFAFVVWQSSLALKIMQVRQHFVLPRLISSLQRPRVLDIRLPLE